MNKGIREQRPAARFASSGSAERERLARNVIVQRARAALSQKALAERAGLTRVTVSNVERGLGASIQTVSRIAHALGTTYSDLFTDHARARARARRNDPLARAEQAREDSVDAYQLIDAIEEAGAELPRYSNAGRRKSASYARRASMALHA